jgi:TonB family protein
MKSIFSLLIICLISFSGNAQVLEYLNKNHEVITDTSKYQPYFYRITSNDNLNILMRIFFMDSAPYYEYRATRFDSTERFSQTEVLYYESGKRKEVSQFDALNDQTIDVRYYESGGIKSKKIWKSTELISEEYFSEDGISDSNPNIIELGQERDMENWRIFLMEKLQYPLVARRMGHSGTVLLGFDINLNGEMENIQVVNSSKVHSSLEKEALRVATAYKGTWTPKIVFGKPEKSRLVLPIYFKLN